MKADMDRKTARRYATAGKLPSEMREPCQWRTRPDPFAEDWAAATEVLTDAPGLEAQTVLELLMKKRPERYNETHLRTLQRRIRRWRAEYGPAREVWFTQAHRPGEAALTDFTSTTELGVTIAGQVFAHLLCVTVLPYSNWGWATVCLSESLAALRRKSDEPATRTTEQAVRQNCRLDPSSSPKLVNSTLGTGPKIV